MSEGVQIAIKLANVVDDSSGTIDVQKSCGCYAEAMARRLRVLYPGSQVQVTCDHQLRDRALEDYCITVPEVPECLTVRPDGFSTLTDVILFHITEIQKELRGRRDWIIYHT